jgi:hypothetical protein
VTISKGVLAVVAAVWGLVSGAIGAILAPEIKDRYFPPKQEVAIPRMCMQPGVRRNVYLQETGNPLAGSPADLARLGIVVLVSVKATGYKGDDLEVRGAVFDEATGEQLRELQPLVHGRWIKPSANETTLVPDIWVPQPAKPGLYRVSPRVYGRGRRRVMEADGLAFSVVAKGAVRLSKRCSASGGA